MASLRWPQTAVGEEEPRTVASLHGPRTAAGEEEPRTAAGRAGYRSKIFDTDTLSSIPVPEQYFFRYQFYEISFNKIPLSQKTIFSAC